MLDKVKRNILNKYYWQRYVTALQAFQKAVPYRNFLPDEEFDRIVSAYGKIPVGPAQDYSIEGMEAQAISRVKEIWKKVHQRPESVLEIGPGAGFVLKRFKEEGIRKAVALDIVDNLYPAVKHAGVEIILSSADNMKIIGDKSYDLVVSWSALEHIPNPQLVFNECLRIMKPGGYFCLEFGPLYYSPWGYHHYSVLKYPYLHLLFPESLIHKYGKKLRGDEYAGYLPWTNGNDADSYKFLKQQLPFGYLLDSYRSGFDFYSSGIILKYPEIFKSKQVSFESFFIDNIQMGVFRKR